jgi:hypothetical protein
MKKKEYADSMTKEEGKDILNRKETKTEKDEATKKLAQENGNEE